MSKDRKDCWTCAKFGDDHECHADIKGGTQYKGWHPPCANWRPAENKRICANCARFDAVNKMCNVNGLSTEEYEDACYNWRDCWNEEDAGGEGVSDETYEKQEIQP